jgi:O-antigen ligase
MPAMNSVYHLKITAPHNLFLEIGVQFGLVIFLLFMGMLLRLFLKQSSNKNKSSKFIIISSLAMFPLTSIIDSGYILSIVIWLFLASLYVIADKQYNVN